MKKQFNIKDQNLFERNKRAYHHVDLTVPYLILLMGTKPTAELLKSLDYAFVNAEREIREQLQADGLTHIRVRIGEVEGKLIDLLDEKEIKRIMGFFLIMRRTVSGDISTNTVPALQQYGFANREELIQALPEMFITDIARLKVARYSSCRDLLKCFEK